MEIERKIIEEAYKVAEEILADEEIISLTDRIKVLQMYRETSLNEYKQYETEISELLAQLDERINTISNMLKEGIKEDEETDDLEVGGEDNE